MRRTAVYDLLVDGEVVYVGCSSRPKFRLQEHRSRCPDFKTARLRIYAWYKSELRAQVREADRIAKLRPKYNFAHNPDVRRKWMDEARNEALETWRKALASGVPYREADRKYEQRMQRLARLERKT